MGERFYRSRAWTVDDRTGGLLDDVLDEVRRYWPRLIVERLVEPHQGDDDNVYFLGDAERLDVVQIDTSRGGGTPFSVESVTSDISRIDTSDVALAVAAILAGLRQGSV